jgi:hypothetical protein
MCRPQLGQLEVYVDILERLNAAIAFKSSDADSRDMVHPVAVCFMYPLIIFPGSTDRDWCEEAYPVVY